MKWILLLCYLNIIGCTKHNNETKQIIKEYINEQIIFPPLDAKITGRDTSCNEFFRNKYKILIYVNPTGCTSCKLHLLEWYNLIQKNKYNKNLSFVFVLTLKDYNEFEWIQNINQFYHPVFYDYSGELNKINHLPKDERFNTFLLDKNNKIVAIGNPVTNERILYLYNKIINEN